MTEMSFLAIYLWAFPVIMVMMTLLWVFSVSRKNASIVDPFWGLGFVAVCFIFLSQSGGFETRKIVVMTLVWIWGLRLSVHLFLRNWGKGEDFRYRKFRNKYGEHRYWWISFFQVFLLQGFLMWLISAPLLGAIYYTGNNSLNLLDGAALLLWLIGFTFEAGGDYQLARFKTDPANKGKLLDTGFWKYTRHPNYFGDAASWWGFGLFAVAAGSYLTFASSILITLLLLKVSGVAMLEESLNDKKTGYREYTRKTNSFLPWFTKD